MTSLAETLFRRGTLGRRILLASVAQVAVLLLALALLLHLTLLTRTEVERAMWGYVEEQGIANEIMATVTRQLVTAADALTGADPQFHAEFSATGDSAYLQIRRFLFRDLSWDQRVQLEAVREQHQRMELTAARALELGTRGETARAREAADEMIQHGVELHQALSTFLRLREADLQQLERRQAALFRYLQGGVAAAALLLALAIFVMARFLYRRLALPLAELATAAERIGTGDLKTQVAQPAEVELGVVANAFNHMSGRLAAARRELEDRNQELEETLQRLQETQAELVQNEKLSAMGRMMAGLAHELNNPLTSVLGYGQLALRQGGQRADGPTRTLLQEYMEPIVAEAERARELVHSLLGFARRAEGTITGVSLRPVIERTTRMRSYAFEQAGLRLVVDEVPDVAVRADAQRLQQAFLNLINNAFDAMAPAGAGRLRISVNGDPNRVTVRFEDDGPGLAALDRIFEPFFTTKPVGEGTGLGLPLVHRFMEEVGGRVVAENRADGGARFVLEFQRAALPADQEAGERPTDPPDQVLTRSGESPVRVLLVEDEHPVRDMQHRLLARLGATVILAENGAQARGILETEPVDLILSDVKMPGGGGGELYHWVLKERSDLADRFLFVTGAPGDPETAGLALERPDLFIHKPFDLTEYLERIVDRLSAAAAATGRSGGTP